MAQCNPTRTKIPQPAGPLCTLVLISLLSGCAGFYFDPAEPPRENLQLTLPELPQKEYWTGLVFNGEKIGFSHTLLTPGPDGWEISSTASLRFRFLGFDKRVTLRAWDRTGVAR